ncbi:phosphoribosyltransferase domain-containing protein [Arthrobacter sp.]|uniref:phosphoribosyltransferase domain-containing protein n=1 Tax=Arthrobacter sp. TaxID=1667 RepID=UPI0026E07826|nr:phosphoribosyltransferase domain-containing protein [Arthrobacter sp.]MDO5754300.1 phosphoribosyltransferase domain-containing protein [Arthrobacter sp.]
MSVFEPRLTANSNWTGDFVARQLDVRIRTAPDSAFAVEDLVGLALRRNPKRAHLLVSTVLAKHVPTEPALVMAAGTLLGAFIASELCLPTHDAETSRSLAVATAALTTALRTSGTDRHNAITALGDAAAGLHTRVPDAVVLGYAETATGLGRLVANALGAYYIHSTRQATPGIESVAGFEEGHSHATSHAMVPTDPHWLDGDGPVVLVDDEFSTGSTVINTIRELHALVPHSDYVVAALIDLRSTADRARFADLAAELGCSIVVTALGTGEISLGNDIIERAAALIAELPPVPAGEAAPAGARGRLAMLELTDADIAPIRSDRYGNMAPPPEEDVAAVAGQVAALLAAQECRGPFAVLGCEENMYLPVAVANVLAGLLPGEQVRFSSTTRSPIVPIDRADYAIAGALSFASHDATLDGPGSRFAYNLSGTHGRPGTIVLFPEPGTGRRDVLAGNPAAGLDPLAVAMTKAADDVVVVLLPADLPPATDGNSSKDAP